MTDASGSVVWAADYKPFGEATITVSTITNNLRGIGQYFDQETGLLYNYTRNLNTTIGRYNEADRIGLRGGINPCRFVGNNPLYWIDPFGYDQFHVWITDTGGRNGSTYGGTMTVTNNGQSVTVNVSSWPNPTNPGPGIAGTQFNPYTWGAPYAATYSTTGHHQSDPAISLTGTIPTVGDAPNPNNYYLNWAVFVEIHCGYSMTRRGSKNCVTIQPDQCQKVWDLLKNNQRGAVTLTR
jgi:RHS repeat-associated protein